MAYEKPNIKTEKVAEEQENGTGLMSSDIIAMYALPGESTPANQEIRTYMETKNHILGNIPELVKEYADKGKIRIALEIAALYPYTSTTLEGSFLSLLSNLIYAGFESNDYAIWFSAAQILSQIPADMFLELRQLRNELIRWLMEEEGDSEAQAIATRITEFAEIETQQRMQHLIVPAIHKNWQSSDRLSRSYALYMVIHNRNSMEPQQIEDFVREGLKDENMEIRTDAAYLILYVRKEMMATFILEALNDSEERVRGNALATIQYAPLYLRGYLAQAAWKNKNIPAEKIMEIVFSLPDDAQEQVWSEWHAKLTPLENSELQTLAQSIPLYKRSSPVFFREDFPKTGSRMTLLGTIPGRPEIDLKEKVIIHHINPSSYAHWAKAFDSGEFWKSRGFDHVPVEPILRARLERGTGKISVFAGVLGPSVSTWLAKTDLFREEIREQINKIISGLTELGIDHGHAHAGNFCLVFHKMKNGEIDITKPPFVYIIDFDRATSDSR